MSWVLTILLYLRYAIDLTSLLSNVSLTKSGSSRPKYGEMRGSGILFGVTAQLPLTTGAMAAGVSFYETLNKSSYIALILP